MRGRVDRSVGIPSNPTYHHPVNLIQKPDYDTALKKTFGIVGERNVSPNLGVEIAPVCIVEDLRDAIRGAQVRTLSMQRTVGTIGQYPYGYVRCAPAGPTVLCNLPPNDPRTLIVERVTVQLSALAELLFIPPAHYSDQLAAGALVGETRAMHKGQARLRGDLAGLLGNAVSGFTAENYGNNALPFGSLAAGGGIFKVNTGEMVTIEGPFVLPPDFICGVSFPAALGGACNMYLQFHCIEVST